MESLYDRLDTRSKMNDTFGYYGPLRYTFGKNSYRMLIDESMHLVVLLDPAPVMDRSWVEQIANQLCEDFFIIKERLLWIQPTINTGYPYEMLEFTVYSHRLIVLKSYPLTQEEMDYIK